ncbi:hypothetical protein AQI88_20170 [Streptomyces cellostaticus]|uniref:DUF4232 domain-containing protein n=1 Tax=Streptomyces cellostaticus TaxID=67285 RepID=A0A101NKY0_9ACTN|nr:hypothetical protein [Streptomyces cellostaticus]KUM94786.1 hypothetical protein AQI88_20170 [Streptomyces cellostaticus]GHI07479.1 hypothetical protein Scel_58000 [Streptomyces cellostaticus]
MTSIRHALVTTVLACAALTLTACQPEDTADADGTVTPSATASHAAKGGAKSDCHTLAPGHKYVQVESVSGAMNTLTVKDATQNCNPDEGAFYQANGKEHEYTVASDSTPIYVLHVKKKGPAKMTAANGGIEHVRVCANGTAHDTDTASADTSDCYGENFYDVAVNSNGKVTEMTELYGS